MWRFRFYSKVLLLLTIVAFKTYAQTDPLGTWVGADGDIKLSKKWEVNLKAQVRFSDNLQITRAFLGEAGVTYNIIKNLSVSGYYRYTGRLKKNADKTGYYYRPYHRFYAEANYKVKLVDWLRLSYRLRYQNQFMDDDASLVADKSYLRNRVELTYKNSSRFSPFISADLFYRLNSDNGGNSFNQIRYKTGTNIAINKRNSVDLFFMIDTPLGDNTNAKQPVVGATYKFDLNLAKKKAKKEKQYIQQ